MSGDLQRVDGCHEGVLLLVGDQAGGVPTSAAINHVEDDVLMDKHQIAFHLLVERVCHIVIARIGGAWTCPLPANLTGLGDFRDDLEDLL